MQGRRSRSAASGITDPIKYQLTRAQIHIRSVPPGTMFDGGVGYISLNPVSETSAEELRQEITAMKGKGMKSLILDLRLNPGGLLDQGVKVADLFLDTQAGDRRPPAAGRAGPPRSSTTKPGRPGRTCPSSCW